MKDISVIDIDEPATITPQSPKSRISGDISKMNRLDLIEQINLLEKENPTKFPASSPLINGVWEVVFSGFGTPGLLIYQVNYAILRLADSLTFLL